MYLYFYKVFLAQDGGKGQFSEETKSINFCVVIFILVFCSMGQTVSSVKVGQDRGSLMYKGAGAKPAGFHPPSFPFPLRDTQKQQRQEALCLSQVLF